MKIFDQSLTELADRLPGGNIGVVGDLVCDLSVFGRSKRVSREAPVIILKHEKEHISLGGAANAVNNMASMGANPFPVGLAGDDHAGKKLVSNIGKKNIPSSNIIVDSARPTTVKTRILGSGLHTTYQQVLRIDQGITDPITGKVEERVLEVIDILVDKCDALVISDYGYGIISDRVLEKINAISVEERIPVLIDSRYSLTKFKKAFLLTPNEPEAEQATGLVIQNDKDVAKAAEILIEITGAKNVCITRGKNGMYLKKSDSPGILIPIFGSDEIADVTGAGDTVMAAFAASVTAGLDLYDAARLATVAGGLVVMKSGTATVSIDEIKRALREFNNG